MSKKRGYTLTEIIITIVILAVLAAVAIPNFSKTVAKADTKQAIASLQAIRAAEKMYYAKWGEYFRPADADQIKNVLGVETNARDFYFSVAASGPENTGFTATATRTSTGGAITLDDAGTWGATDPEEAPTD